PHKQAGHMTAPDQCCSNVRKFLPRRRPHMTQSGHPKLYDVPSVAVQNNVQPSRTWRCEATYWNIRIEEGLISKRKWEEQYEKIQYRVAGCARLRWTCFCPTGSHCQK